jgi:hemolysin D
MQSAGAAPGADVAGLPAGADLGRAAGRHPEQPGRAGARPRQGEPGRISGKIAYDREIDHQEEAEVRANQSEIRKYDEILPLAQERVDAKQSLLDKGLTPRMEMLQLQQQFIEMQRNRDAAQAHLSEAKSQIASIQRQKAQTEEEFKRDRLKELADAETQAIALDQELRKAEERQRLKTITAPVAGTVQQLILHTLGGMIQPGQALMAIVPDDSGIEIEAMIQNQDIGFVAEGQDAVTTLDAFPFTRYGTVLSKIKIVSEDAVSGGDSSGDEAQRAQGEMPSASNKLLYAARVTLDSTTMDIDGKEVKLTPGMAVTVEVKTGKRKLIEYLLSPLMRMTKEAGRER